MAVSFCKIFNKTLPDLCLLIVWVGALLKECLFEVIALGDFVAVFVFQLKGKVTNDPHKGGQDFIETDVFVLRHAQLDVLCEINYQG